MTKQNKYPNTLAVFDLDNTLIDSDAKLKADFIGAMQRLGIQITPEEARKGRWYETAKRYGFSQEQFDYSFNQRKTWEQSLKDREVTVFPGTISLLSLLKGREIKTGLLSLSKPSYTDLKLDYLGLRPFFDKVITVTPRKDATKKYGAFHLVSEMNPETIEEAYFIGDKLEDVALSRNVQKEFGIESEGILVDIGRKNGTTSKYGKGRNRRYYPIVQSLSDIRKHICYNDKDAAEDIS